MDRRGTPIRGALVEIWQADTNGAYIHSRSPSSNRDAGFQGYGKFVTGSTGEYLFRTVKPGLYPGRTRHVHYQITMPGSSSQKLVTQLYVQGDALNANDGVLNGIRDTAQRNSSSYRREDEHELTFMGFLTFLDRPKEGAAEAVADLAKLGVSVKLITGDHRLVAQHVTRLVGMRADRVLAGDDLDNLHDEALWREAERTDLFVEVDFARGA